MTRTLQAILLRFHPGDWAVIVLLGTSVIVAVVRLPAVGASLLPLLLIQFALLTIFGGWVVWWTRNERRPIVQFLRPCVLVAVIGICYTTLGSLGMAAMPYRADAFLSRLDCLLFRGVDPSLFLQRFQSPSWVEFFSFIYSAFIPYIYLSIGLGCLGRPPLERDQFMTGWVFTYVFSYLGYIFIPAHGPILFHQADYQVILQGGTFYHLVVRGMDASGGLQGVFPSLHIGCSVYLCLFDLQTNRLRGLTYLPMVILIYGATLMLRYHYVVDLIAGTIIPAVCISLGRRAIWRWSQERAAAGMPALPAGESDDLSAVSSAGQPHVAPLFPAN